jgi:hypothetical protein
MAVPPRPGTDAPRSSFESDPSVPRPLPDRGRSAATPAVAMVLAVLLVVALIVLL